MKTKLRMAFLALAFAMLSGAAPALTPDEILTDPALESRARALTHQLRCPVCQGQAIDESNAPLAADLRRVVRARIAAGETDADILAYLRGRYGDYILMQPPLSHKTAALWLTPFLVFALSAGGAVMFIRRHKAKQATERAG